MSRLRGADRSRDQPEGAPVPAALASDQRKQTAFTALADDTGSLNRFREDQFERALDRFRDYPQNISRQTSYKHISKALNSRILAKASSLCTNSKADVTLLDYYRQGQFFIEHVASDLRSLSELLRTGRGDPKARILFLGADNSKAPLNISIDMLLYLLTYHQVSPAILDFLLGFGSTTRESKFPFGGFRAELRLANYNTGANLKDLGRSGRGLWMCYNLRSVESYRPKKDWPWSIRQTAVYHSFDVITGRATWIVTKANKLMEKRIKSDIELDEQSSISDLQTNRSSFSATLDLTLAFVDWSCENWASYIDFLSDRIDDATQDISKVAMERPIAVPQSLSIQLIKPVKFRTDSDQSFGSLPKIKSWISTHTKSSFKLGSLSEKVALEYEGQRRDAANFSEADAYLKIVQEGAHERLEAMQSSQDMEEKALEVIQVLETSCSILGSIAKFYSKLLDSDNCPAEFKQDSRMDNATLEHFFFRIEEVQNELHLQKLRASSLQQQLGQRRGLLLGMVEYFNKEASRVLAEKANRSQVSIERMNEDMHELAQRTKQETVSMRIITLITLIFLPGTFISTLMSTDVIRWQNGSDKLSDAVFSGGAFGFFWLTSIPIIILTFSGWYFIYHRVNARDLARGRAIHSNSIGFP